MEKTKSFNIPKQLFVQAFQLVKANAGGTGVDKQSLSDFEMNLKDNLYKLWNRMSSGCYFPPAVKAMPIPKKTGGKRILGVPTVGDRICQMVAKLIFEPMVERYFLPDSYGYRPNKSALDAIETTRQRCWYVDWVIEFDIRGLFDNIPHELLMKAVNKHTQEQWILLYIERWLKAPMQQEDGEIVVRSCGTPQGGVISPVLSNLFLHYVFDTWMKRTYPEIQWCRYADDGLLHCKTLRQAERILQAIKERFNECGLELHPDKTKIVYCKDGKRKMQYPVTSFEFLGYEFKGRKCKNLKDGSFFKNFIPGVSKDSLKSMRARTRKLNVRNRTDLSLEEIASWFNPILQGWFNYYGKFTKAAMMPLSRHFNCTLVSWAMKKYRRRKISAGLFIENIFKNQPYLFVHWRIGLVGGFA